MLWLDHAFGVDYGFLALVLAFVCVGLTEFYSLIERKGCRPFRKIGLLGGCGYIAVRWLAVRPEGIDDRYAVLAVTAFVFAVFLAQGITLKAQDALRNVSAGVFGFIYIPFLGSHVLDMRYLSSTAGHIGEQAFVSFVIVAKSVDMGAYFVGKAFGRTKMTPVVSPKKSVEGLLAGLATGVLAGLLLHQLPAMRIASAGWTVVVCLAIGIAGQLGDLAESMIKRDVGVKDSSGAIPGLGGTLDVIDCLLVAAPVAYYLLLLGPKL